MKNCLVFLISLFVTLVLLAADADIQGRVTSFGIFSLSGQETILKGRKAPTGVSIIPANAPVLVMATNMIPARLGIRFGMYYEIKNLRLKDGSPIEVVKSLRHPAMTTPDGVTSKGYQSGEKQRVIDGRVVGWTGYGFDKDFELLPGIWEFEMRFEGKLVCKQQFTVFRE
jgi:hypothetical protein